MIYLDHAASTSMWDEALDVLVRSSGEDYCNPSSSHKFGRGVLKKIENSRKFMLDFLDAGSLYDLFFTSSATESNNTVIKGLNLKEGDIVYVSEADHPSLLKPAQYLENFGAVINYIPMREDGGVDLGGLLNLMNGKEKLLVISFVNNQSGNINDIRDIAAKVKEKNKLVHVHVDGVQGFCKIPFSLSDGSIDSFSVSSHKIGGPKGAAALYLRKGIALEPLLSGGGQEGGMRSSTRPTPLILSFSESVRYLSNRYEKDIEYVSDLNKKVKKNLEDSIPGIFFPFSGENISSYILNLIIPGISSDIIVRHLEEKDIYISTTSACSSGDKGENPVFRALGIPEKFHNSVYRVSFSGKTTGNEVQIFCSEIISIYNELSELL
ncbi:MAG: cysteine desulfurase [Candidatus Aminicenantes bacterium]|nr:cysteine desulfurase [Candidatus Aminicenantes bacterium]